MALAYLNACGFRATASGTGAFVVASALTGYYEPDDCLQPSAIDGATYRYHAISDDGTQFEEGDGVWSEGDQELTRAVIRNSSNSGSIVTFSAAPKVFMGGATAQDMDGWVLVADVDFAADPTDEVVLADLTDVYRIRMVAQGVRFDTSIIEEVGDYITEALILRAAGPTDLTEPEEISYVLAYAEASFGESLTEQTFNTDAQYYVSEYGVAWYWKAARTTIFNGTFNAVGMEEVAGGGQGTTFDSPATVVSGSIKGFMWDNSAEDYVPATFNAGTLQVYVRRT